MTYFKKLEISGLGATIGTVNIPALAFADDIVLISDDPNKLQNLINLCQKWAENNGMAFRTDKCKVMVFNGSPKSFEFKLYGDILEIVESHKYLGITLTSKYVTNLFRIHFSDIAERAKLKASVIRRYGFHEDGLRISTAIKLYKLMIRPLLEYCAQSLSYTRYSSPLRLEVINDFERELEHFQTQTLKTLINCPRSTSPSIVRLFCGVEPLACRLEILKLRYFWKVLMGPTDSITHKILSYRRKKFLDFNKGFAHEVFNVCCKYNMIHIWNGIAIPSGNQNSRVWASRIINPFRLIKNTIISHNLREDLNTGRSRSCSFASLFLSSPSAYQKKYHLVGPFCKQRCFATPKGRKHFIKAILHPCNFLEDCPKCGQRYRDKLNHFISACPRIVGFRKELYLRLTLYNFPKDRTPEKHDLLEAAIHNSTWRKCIVKFLHDTDF